MVNLSTAQEYGLYIHIPYCKHRCPYCHFSVTTRGLEAQSLFVEDLLWEWQRYQPQVQKIPLRSIYFGGGTPSLLHPSLLQHLIQTLCASSSPIPSCEITLEANPDGLTRASLQKFYDAGVNRLSIGVQAFSNSLLKRLGRTHTVADALRSIEWAHEVGFREISIDLMLDLPDQKPRDVEEILETIPQLPITHLSCYQLTLEAPALWARHPERIQRRQPREEEAIAAFEQLSHGLASQGLARYEISAFARPGSEAIHNTGYWTRRPWLALGPSAWGEWQGVRWQNLPNLSEYRAAIKGGTPPLHFIERLPTQLRSAEALALGLRLFRGVALAPFIQQHGPFPPLQQKALRRLLEEAWLIEEAGILKLSERGALFYDQVASDLLFP